VRVNLPIVFLLCLGVAALASPSAFSQAAAPQEQIRYSKVREFFIPFYADPKRPIAELRLFAQRNSGVWEQLATAQPNQKGFTFRCTQDGSYGVTVQTIYKDGTPEPTTDKLQAEMRIIVDTQPPKIALRPFSAADGVCGVEWDITDDYLDSSSIRLEYRWPTMVEWAPIDKGVSFRARDQRTWKLNPDQRIEIRVRAMDLAKNEAISQGVTTSPNVGDNRQFSGSSGSGNTATADPATPRPGGTQHYVNSTIVKLNYNVTVGPSGVKKVTLWRQEEKQPWTKVLEKDGANLRPDNQPAGVLPGERAKTETLPLIDDVKKDGIYGYIIVVESRAGTSGRDPKPNDPPHTSVIVDTTPPVVKMTEPKVRANGTPNQGALVDIVWQATDKNMAAAPITLEYAEKIEGPWRVIAEKIENTGKFSWAVPPTEPFSFFVRVKAIDRAGNVAQDVSKEPVVVDLTVPQVEIHDVAPVPSPTQPR